MTMKFRVNTSIGRWGVLLIMALLLSMMALPVMAAEGDTDTAAETEATATVESTEATEATETTEAAAEFKVMVDGQEMNYGDAPPIVQDNRTYVGVRALALALGVPESGIAWDQATQTATLTKDETVVKLVIGSNVMTVNEAAQTMDAMPFASNNRTYLPVRYLAEALGFTVSYDAVANQAIITSPAAPEEPEADELTEADNGTTVTIATGATFVLALESNPSTGYTWQLVTAPDAAIVSVSDVQFEPGDTELIGAPGTDRWLFTGLAAGTTELQLDYVGPGTDAEIAQTFTLTIVVE